MIDEVCSGYWLLVFLFEKETRQYCFITVLITFMRTESHVPAIFQRPYRLPFLSTWKLCVLGMMKDNINSPYSDVEIDELNASFLWCKICSSSNIVTWIFTPKFKFRKFKPNAIVRGKWNQAKGNKVWYHYHRKGVIFWQCTQIYMRPIFFSWFKYSLTLFWPALYAMAYVAQRSFPDAS